MGIDSSHISDVIHGKRKTVNGLKFEEAGYILSLLMIVKTLPLLILLLIYTPPVMWRKNSLIISDNDSEFVKLEIKDNKKFIDLIHKYGGCI